MARSLSRASRRVVSALALGTLACASEAGCTGDFDTSRATTQRGSLGREMYTLVCDRVGAQALREDITGSSYHSVCHADAKGEFGATVDASLLPPLDPAATSSKGEPVPLSTQQANRAHRIARIEAIGRRRDDLIAAFDTAFANEPIATEDLANPDPVKSCDPPASSGERDLRTELKDTLGRMTDLYNDDTVPHLTRALARVMTDVDKSKDAQDALAQIDARKGYRPEDIAMGAVRPALAYPRIVELANALLRLMSADTDPLGLAAEDGAAPPKKAGDRVATDRVPGNAHGAIVDLLAAMREEMRASKVIPTPPALTITPDARDASLLVLSRPRGNLEIARTLLLHEDAAFSAGQAPRWVVRRDARGFATVKTSADGKVPLPFLDLTGPDGKPDGLADIDALGRFVTKDNVEVATPFRDMFGEVPPTRTQNKAFGRDADGRAVLVSTKALAYEFVDVSSTFLAAFARDLVPLLEPDPKLLHETVMDLLGGFTVVAGAREAEPKTDKAYPDPTGAANDTHLKYRAFLEDQSPVLDLVYAVGQVLADRQTDDTLALLQKLATDKPQVLARLIGVGLQIKAIADQHPEARIPADSMLWDEMLDVLATMAQKPKLIEDVIRAFGDDATLDMPRSAVAYLSMRDELTYDRNNLNGPAFNLTTNKVETLKTPVDRTKPDTGSNRSAFQRFLQALHDTNGMSVCTKEGAVAHIVWKGVAMDFPSFTAKAACVLLGADAPADPLPVCGMLRIKNIAEELVNAVLGAVNLDVRDDCMRKLMVSPLTGIVGGPDAFLEEVSGIKGFNTKPTVPGINRLVFFDLPHDGTSGDTKNPKTLNFLRDLFDNPPTLACPAVPFTDKDGAQLNLRQCSSYKDSLHGRDQNALFPIEQLGFLESAKPLASAFHQNDSNLLFVNLFDVLHRHWGSAAQSKEECDKSLPKTSAKWCAQDGAVTYEPLIAEALATDLFAALHDSVKELSQIKIAHCDTRDGKGACTKQTEWDGVKVLAEAVNDLVDPVKNKGLVRRDGNAAVTRNDGSTNKQVTPIYLLIDALKGFDARLADHAAKNPADDRTPSWRRARSQIVDQLFTVSGKGKDAKLANPSVEKMMPVLVSTLRSQIAAHCPDPAKECTWARADLAKNMKDVVTGPTFAGVLDVLDAVRADAPARIELEKLVVFLLREGQEEASRSTLTALADLMQVFEDDANMTALLRATAEAAAPEVVKDGRVESRGLLLATIEVLSRVLGEAHAKNGDRLCSKEIDPNRTMAVVLRKLVTPPGNGKPPPIEVLIDVIADVNRLHPEEAANGTKLEGPDYGSIARETADFCTHPSRGLEQVYTVIKQATKDL